MLPSGKDFRLTERERKIMEKRRELSEQRLDRIIERTRNPPSVSPYLIATVHEELALKQMQKYFGVQGKRETDMFWKNQKRFLEFINFEKANSGYKYSHAWFLNKNPEYASKFENMNSKELRLYRENNRRIYNILCERMHETAPEYASLDKILAPLN
jgi:hypothetical protein